MFFLKRKKKTVKIREKKVKNMGVQNAEPELIKILEKRSFDMENGDFLTAVDAMDEFYSIGFAACESDMLLCEVSREYGSGECTVDILRQFGFEGEDEYWQLRIELTYADSQDLLKYSGGDWCAEEDGDDVEQYFDELRNSELCKAIYDKERKARCKIYFDET